MACWQGVPVTIVTQDRDQKRKGPDMSIQILDTCTFSNGKDIIILGFPRPQNTKQGNQKQRLSKRSKQGVLVKERAG